MKANDHISEIEMHMQCMRDKFSFSYSLSTSCFGSADLDFRPPEMERCTLKYQIQECPTCGYASVSIELPPPKGVTVEWLQSEEYQFCSGLELHDPMVRAFYRNYLICKKRRRLKRMLFALRNTVWICDDLGLIETAQMFRKETSRLAHRYYQRTWNPGIKILECDMLRRAGQFEGVLHQKRIFSFKNRKQFKALFEFEQIKANERDDRRYTIAEALQFKS